MKLKFKNIEKMHKYDVEDLTDEERKILVNTGLERIKSDEAKLIEYAVTSILMDKIRNMSDSVEKLEKKTKKKINKTKLYPTNIPIAVGDNNMR